MTAGDLEEIGSLDEISPYTVPLMPLMRENDLDVEPPRALPFRQNAYLYSHMPGEYLHSNLKAIFVVPIQLSKELGPTLTNKQKTHYEIQIKKIQRSDSGT